MLLKFDVHSSCPPRSRYKRPPASGRPEGEPAQVLFSVVRLRLLSGIRQPVDNRRLQVLLHR